MKDFLDHELAVGDLVVMVRSTKTSFNLFFGRVMSFTPKMVNIDYTDGKLLHNTNKASYSLIKVLAMTPEVQQKLDTLNRLCVERLKRESV